MLAILGLIGIAIVGSAFVDQSEQSESDDTTVGDDTENGDLEGDNLGFLLFDPLTSEDPEASYEDDELIEQVYSDDEPLINFGGYDDTLPGASGIDVLIDFQ